MKRSLVLSLLVLAGCMSPARFDSKFEARFCEEWKSCNPEFECELAELDYSDCEFDGKAAKDCLSGDWVCDTSNSAFPLVEPPEVCNQVYTGCTADTGTPQPTTTDTATTTSSR